MKLPCFPRAKWFACLALLISHAVVFAEKFEITLAQNLATNALNGRLLLILNTTNNPEPYLSVGHIDAHGPFVFGRDAEQFTSRRSLIMDESATAGLNAKLSQLKPSTYFVQAVLDVSKDIRSATAPGNLVSAMQQVQFDPKSRKTVKLELNRAIPEETPAETDLVKFVKIQSKLLSDFHQRPIFLRAGIILPTSYANEPGKRYPLWIYIGGFGGRCSQVTELMEPRSGFRDDWTARGAPQMVYALLDGVGPNGDSYHINSANNGPYGDALVTELIPAIEREFRTTGGARGRMLSGRSTGGWVALALQIFYPDFFGGAWSFCPDSVDFRSFQLVNIYDEENAFVNPHGEERPSARDENGDVRLLMRREVQNENVFGHQGKWTRSGMQWGAWNAVYGPRGADGQPVPLWDADGNIDRAVAKQWKKYDLRLVLESNWNTLAPKLQGKIHIAVGDADDYFLNNAVHLLDEGLSEKTPKIATFKYGAREGHGWMGTGLGDLMKEIHAATEAKP